MEARITLLSVSYDDVLRVAREAILKDAGYEVVSAAHLSQALEMISGVEPACVILGHTVPLGGSGNHSPSGGEAYASSSLAAKRMAPSRADDSQTQQGAT